jgi:hypothetical protein
MPQGLEIHLITWVVRPFNVTGLNHNSQSLGDLS